MINFKVENPLARAVPGAFLAAALSSSISIGVIHAHASLIVLGAGTRVVEYLGDWIFDELQGLGLCKGAFTFKKDVMKQMVKDIVTVALQSFALYVASAIGGTLCFAAAPLSYIECSLVATISRFFWLFFNKMCEVENISLDNLRTRNKRSQS